MTKASAMNIILIAVIALATALPSTTAAVGRAKPDTYAHSATTCRKTVRVIVSVTVQWDMTQLGKYSNGCWALIRISQSAGAKCQVDSAKPQWWAYNDIGASPASATTDRAAIKACYSAASRNGINPFGWLFYGYGGNGAWPLTGHVPPRVGKFYLLLELYRGTDIVTDRALSLWRTHPGFGAIVNFAGENGTDATAQSAVLSVCQATPTSKYIGLYAGSGEPLRDSVSRLRAVAAALTLCTT